MINPFDPVRPTAPLFVPEGLINVKDTLRHRLAGHPWDPPPAASDLNNPKPRARVVLDSSVRLTGDLWSEGDVQLDGHLCGNISCVQLIVSKDAAVTGVIIAHEAVIRGKTTGIIRAIRVLLQETAHVESEIIYRSLSVEEGVSFEGIARPRPNPLEEDFAMSPTPEDHDQRPGITLELHKHLGLLVERETRS
jgi:cytoskeletal protein CcmA (bactofilin family)